MVKKPIQYCLLAFLVLVPMGIVVAHEMRPAYLQINQVSETTYQVFWKIPRQGDMVIRLRPVFPEAALTESGLPKYVSGAMLYTYELKSVEAIEGQEFYIDGLEQTMIDVLVTIRFENGEQASLMIKPDENRALFPGSASKWQVIKSYTVLGVEHIWFGIDHLLFVLALIIITRGFRKIVKTITAFTIAHSITLSLAVLGFTSLPGPPVEAVIALSIVFLAAEILKNLRGRETLTSRKPWLVAFTFGLLHGFGFAGALTEVGLPSSEIPLALAFFNIGVELGQLAFVLVALSILKLLAMKPSWPLVLQKIPAYIIGSVASFWVIDRILAFWY